MHIDLKSQQRGPKKGRRTFESDKIIVVTFLLLEKKLLYLEREIISLFFPKIIQILFPRTLSLLYRPILKPTGDKCYWIMMRKLMTKKNSKAKAGKDVANEFQS